MTESQETKKKFDSVHPDMDTKCSECKRRYGNHMGARCPVDEEEKNTIEKFGKKSPSLSAKCRDCGRRYGRHTGVDIREGCTGEKATLKVGENTSSYLIKIEL